MKPVCLIIGAGAGIGGNVGRKFAQEGFHAVLCRRSDEAGLNNMVGDINSHAGRASGGSHTHVGVPRVSRADEGAHVREGLPA